MTGPGHGSRGGDGGREWAGIERSDDLTAIRHTRRHPPDRGRGRRRLLALVVVVGILALVVGLAYGYVRDYFSSGEVGGEVSVVIAPGDSLSTIGQKLEDAGVVGRARVFVMRASNDGYGTQLKPGEYTLLENQPYEDIIAILLEGQAPPTVKVTLPEGSTLEQSAALAGAKIKGVKAKEYLRIARDAPPAVKIKGYKAGTKLEGLLFPATYEVEPATEAGAFIERQLEAFAQNLAKVDMTRAAKANLTAYDVVIIASMVEREAQVAAERPIVAAVIWNRLREGMLLQIDATIQYALGEQKEIVTFDDLKIDSPYNTYKHAGLPPTPIANPGLASLQAAADPAAVDYLYYVARADGTGRHYFSRSYQEFLANQAKARRNSQQ